jgi:hypothetical protein
MPYNPDTDKPVLISKQHHALLKELAATPPKRSMRVTLELLIEQATK